MNHKHSRHQGLILLIVLGMLSLFSLLAISFMVITSQTRRSNAGRASRDFRGTAPEKLLDDVIRPVLRGTTDPSSFLRGQSLLADLHGSQEAPLRVRVRNTMFGVIQNMLPPNATTQNYNTPITHNSSERPLLLAGRFLRIPIVASNRAVGAELPRDDGDFPTTMNPNPVINPQSDLPFEHDAWTSRVATFLSGPLQGQSFRIIRYLGFEYTASTAAPSLAQSYSIVIDLQDASAGLATVGSTTRSIAEWALQLPAGSNQAAKRGLFLCYGNVPAAGNTQLSGGYEILINATPLNSHGMGITGNLANPSVPDNAPFSADPVVNAALAAADANLRNLPAAFQPNRTNSTPITMGDADEDYDAADYQNWYLSHRYSGAVDSSQVIPSFHRAALINYIVNLKDPATYENGELFLAVHRILRAAGRPLSVRVVDGSITDSNNQPVTILRHPDFDGGNQGQFTASGDERSTQLNAVWASPTSWQDLDNPTGVAAFLDWVRWLTKGPWDVDNDSDGVADGIWIDPNLPLTTSPEGKLLKVLVSYTIESLDSRLDLNAVGNVTQAAASSVYASPTNDSYSVGVGVQLAQGFGYGPAEASLRHLFGAGAPGNANYKAFLDGRYAGLLPSGPESLPGIAGNDIRSQLDQREQLPSPFLPAISYSHGVLPAIPKGTQGRISIGIDRMGNPLMVNSGVLNIFGTSFDQVFNDHYETSLLNGGRGDSLYTIAEWERMLRPSDWDRSSMPRRLNTMASVVDAVTPRSRHLRYTPAGVSRTTGRQSDSMYALIREMYQFNPPTSVTGATVNPLSYQAYRELFPVEFQRGQAFNINRPLGNGVDDDGDGNVDESDENSVGGAWSAYGQQTVSSVMGGAPSLVPIVEPGVPGKIELPAGSGTYLDRGIYEGNLDPTFEALAVSASSGGGDSDGDGQQDADTLSYQFGSQSRQLLARNLYCLAMLILPDDLYLSNLPTPVSGYERARRIAQWAVNAVDMRDADSAMTRFPYDPDPFTRPTSSDPFWQPNPAAGHVVWGLEQSDVILTESLATHDLRVDDTVDDISGQDVAGGDPHKDQLRMPEGSAFLELLALRTTSAANDTTAPGVSSSLYDTVGGNKVLNLSSLSPPIDVTDPVTSAVVTTRYPVYRVAISEPHADPMTDPGTPLALQDPTNISQRLTTTYQLSTFPSGASPNESGLVWDTSGITNSPLTTAADSPYEIDRVLVFTPWSSGIGIPGLQPGLTPAEIAGRVFSNYNAGGSDITMQGGDYLVVGPRDITYFGSRNVGGALHEHQPNPHRIALGDFAASTPVAESNWTSVFGTDPTSGTTNQRVDKRPATRNVLTMVAGQDVPWSLTVPMQTYQRPSFIGFNVSAPYGNSYYQAPTDQLDSSDTGPDAVTAAPGYQNLPADAYYDYGTLGTTVGMNVPDEPFDGVGARPLSTNTTHSFQWPFRDGSGQPEPGTAQNWCTAFLQRLADPDRPWHRDLNPYITIDWIPIDLTVFSGEDSYSLPAGRNYQFATRQKTGAMTQVAGGYQMLAAGNAQRTFYSYDTTELADSVAVAGSNAYFDRELPLDWASGGTPQTLRPTLNGTSPNHFATLGYLNSTFGLSGETGASTSIAGFLGAPSVEPAGLFWLDRQFVNPHELTWVPLSAPGQLMQDLTAPTSGGGADPYTDEMTPNDYAHLPNFFQSIQAQSGSNNQLAPVTLFELVETPSPWSDAEEFVPPADVAFTGGTTLIDQATDYIFEPLRAPNNRLSTYTEPGRVNINDISEPAVWQGLMWNALPPTARETIATAPTFWNELQQSRAGYTSPGTNVIPSPNPLLNSEVPSQFGGVFKSAFAAGMVPQTRNPQMLDQVARNASGQLVRPAGVTLMRPQLGGSPSVPVFRPNYSSFSLTSQQPFMDYLPFTRLSNLVTTRSNVFSVRVTVGFFEFNSATGVGREYGIDEGTAKRHKAFYVIDRSIPVGYQEGLDLNTDQCILMRRIIE